MKVMNIEFQFAEAHLPAKLVCALLYFAESKMPFKSYGREEYRKRLLSAAVHMVRFYKLKETKKLKALVSILLDALMEIYRFRTQDMRIAPQSLINSNRRSLTQSLYSEEDAEPPP